MTISIICTGKDSKPWVSALKQIDPTLDIQLGPNEQDKNKVTFALCWKHPAGSLKAYPNLRCVSSMGAGIDHFLNDPDFPQKLPVVRIVDPLLAKTMFEYVCTAAMYYLRDFDCYQNLQEQLRWQPKTSKSISDTTIGIMGLGNLGKHAAIKFANMGFNVCGWARIQKSVDGVQVYAGENQLNAFLSQSNILICLLPLTKKTEGILNLKLFNRLPKGAYLINVARGEHLIEDDLINALNQSHLNGACLDVFREEPLPTIHPFWEHEKIMLTPHCSSVTEPSSVAPQIVNNYRLMQEGKPLLNQVQFDREY